MTETPPDTVDTTVSTLMSKRASRRSFVTGTLAAGAAVAGLGIVGVHAQSATNSATSPDTAQDILNVAATAEQLGIVLYTSALAGASALKIADDDVPYLRAALIEEQIHLNFLLANGAKPLTSTFSFPSGAATFSDIMAFATTLEALETAFVAAYTAAIWEFSVLGQTALARVSQMIAGIEAQHYALGRIIAKNGGVANSQPPNNWAFAPQIVPSVGAAVTALTSAGFLSPASGNSYSYTAADLSSSANAPIAAEIMYQQPFVQS
jgi:hypothetical protein